MRQTFKCSILVDGGRLFILCNCCIRKLCCE